MTQKPIGLTEADDNVRGRVVLEFPKDLLDKPVIWNLSRRYNLLFNILRANIDDGKGYMVLELEGQINDYQSGMAYLADLGVKTQPLKERISLDKVRCTDCGACVGVCPTDSLVKDEHTSEVVLQQEKCIVCGICTKACPVRAISLKIIPSR